MSEMVEACCTLAREQIEVGDYDGGCAALQRWWKTGEWPRQEGLETQAAAELMFTAGTLSGWVASTTPTQGGQHLSQGLLNGAIALFEHLGQISRACEARIELGYCYYRQGFFDFARTILRSAFDALGDAEQEMKAVALIRIAIIDRHAGRLRDALGFLNKASTIMSAAGSFTKGRFHLEFATTLKNLGIAESQAGYFDQAIENYEKSQQYFERVGNLRYAAAVENNHGYLLLSLKRFDDAHTHLERARKLFDGFGDSARRAQVDETLAQLYLASEQYEAAERSIKLAVDTLETSGEDALLAEALSTQGLIMCRLGRRYEAKPTIERAQRVAERCGDYEGAGKSLLILIEEMCEQLGDDERREIGARLDQLLANSQQASTRERLRTCLDRIAAAHAEHETQREKAAHADKMAALGELSFGVAHNVNNTLTGILGRAQLLLRTTDPEKMTAGIQLIVKSAEDGAHIIRRIQNFARQRPSREFEAVSVTELLKDVCELTRPRWESRPDAQSIRLALCADTAAVVTGDPVELREVLVNIIYNATDAMPNGGEIRISAQETKDSVILLVADSGTGMPPEVKSRLFDPFFTTKGKAGTGMGLAVSFGIVRRHNGSITVDSEVGRGTTFRISLPVATQAMPRTAQANYSESDTAKGNVRVLVVDDEVAVREVLSESLRAEGCEVVLAENAHLALELYDSANPKFDAVFTDIGMAEMSGWELATAIRRRSETVSLAIISGWADAISRESRNTVKADWVVSKPFDINRISEIANEIAERKRLVAFP
jgi:signal transduction histidine kinase/ActR/RegA family two-component response regulator/Flp pilus assembly protein TadD